MSSRIEVRNVAKIFADPEGKLGGAVTAIGDVSVTIEAGEFVCLVGPSGCGKSTLLDIVAGLEPSNSGEVLIGGERVRGPHPKMAMVFQSMSLLPWRTALDNAAFGLELQGVAEARRREVAMEMLRLVKLDGFAQKYPAQLSGGMNQRVAIARALALSPDILLMDEPFGALDEQTRRLMGQELLRIWERTGKTILFVTHSIDEAIQLSDRIVLLSGRPSRVKEVMTVPLPRPRTLESLTSPAAGEIERKIWTSLLEEVGGSELDAA